MRYISLYKFIKGIDKLDKEDQKITYYSLKKLGTDLSNRLIIDCFRLTTALRFLTMRSHWRGPQKINVYKKTDTWKDLQKFVFKEIEGKNNNKQ